MPPCRNSKQLVAALPPGLDEPGGFAHSEVPGAAWREIPSCCLMLSREQISNGIFPPFSTSSSGWCDGWSRARHWARASATTAEGKIPLPYQVEIRRAPSRLAGLSDRQSAYHGGQKGRGDEDGRHGQPE